MPRVFRLVKEKYISTPLAGGSAGGGQRWSPAGIDVLYASASPELALVEILAGLMPIRLDELPKYYLITIVIPDDEQIRVYKPSDLFSGWNDPVRPLVAQTFFGDWLNGDKELTVSVPSAVVPFSSNYIIHRKHTAFGKVVVAYATEFSQH